MFLQVRKLQENGKLTKQTIEALQHFIRDNSSTSIYSDVEECPINGELDPPTVRALQEFLDPDVF